MPRAPSRTLPGLARHRLAQLVAAALLAAPLQARAGGPGDDDDGSWSLELGAAVKTEQKPYVGMGRDNRAFPLVRFDSRYVELAGPGIGLKLPPYGDRSAFVPRLKLLAEYDLGQGYEAGDAWSLAGMAERESGFWGGLAADWETDLGNIGLKLLADVSGHSKGRKLSLGFERMFHPRDSLMLVPRLGVNWLDKKTVDYYYGVRAAEARPGRPAYQGRSGTEFEVGLRVVYDLGGPHGLFFDAGLQRLPGAVQDSPIVDRSTRHEVMLGYTYRFR